MLAVFYRAIKYMNAEDALLAREEKPRKREQQEDTWQDQGRKKPRTGDRRDERHPKPSGGRFTSFTPLNTPLDRVLMQIKDQRALTFPGKLKSDPNRHSRDKYCRFHRDHGHDTVDCFDLKQQIEAFIRQGGTATIGSSKKARKTYLWMVQNVQLTVSVPKIARRESPIIGFSEEDAQCLHHPHDDALVVSIRVGDYNVHWVLIDNGIKANILYYLVFQQMGIDRNKLILTSSLLVGFEGTRVFLLGLVTILVTVGDYPQQITKDMTFLVVDCSSAYNAIIGRLSLNSWKAATSTYHLMIKFSTDYGVDELRGD
ncbi:uncharacterized protein LOC112007679 [Quercus suber]|uniref:uncharacterized protein LOC112007679 n=1 Tax=Quercus suber TaxID=58331 RepID=UPI000CE26210|nr:uncharacterized protein LOC112007679 [Quercus suber]